MRRFHLADFGSALLVLLTPVALHAATYYVAPTGSDNNPGNQAQPFSSMARAQDAAVPGDTVYFHGGTYAYTSGTTKCPSGTASISGVVLMKSGASGNTIKYWAVDGEKPVFDFSGIKDSCRVKGLLVSGNWIHLKGLEITGVPQNNNLNHESWGVWVSGSNNTFETLNIHHIMGTGLFIQDGGNNLVLNCDSHHNYDPMTSNGAGQSGDGFGCHISAGNPGNTFRGCRSWWNSDDGYDLINAFSPVTIEDSWSWYHGYLPGTMTVLPAGNGNGFKSGGYGLVTSTFPSSPIKHTVRNCLAVANKMAGFYTNHHPDSCFFYNNTGYGNNPDFNMLGLSRSGAAITVGVFRNNVALGPKTLSNNSGADDASNSWTLPVTANAADFQAVSVTGLDGPRQADGSLPNIPNFHLVAGSDLIDKGQNVMLPFVGAAPDLGAFEYGAPTTSVGSGGATGSGGSGTTSGSGGSGGGTGSGTGGSGTGGDSTGSGGAMGTATGGVSGTGGQGVLQTGGSGVTASGGNTVGGTGGIGSTLGTGGHAAGPDSGVSSSGSSAAGGCGCGVGPGGGGLDLRGVAASIALLILAMTRAARGRRNHRVARIDPR